MSLVKYQSVVAVLTCATAAAALEQLRDKSHGFDLVLSDVYMPGA
jgi:response regulator of citrate/malate metabolism